MEKKIQSHGNIRDPNRQRRKHARIRVNNLKATFQIQGSNKEYDCVILDLGTGGIGIESKTLLYPGDRVIIKFWLQNRYYEIPSMVSRVSGKVAGLVFENPESEAIGNIQSYIHEQIFRESKP